MSLSPVLTLVFIVIGKWKNIFTNYFLKQIRSLHFLRFFIKAFSEAMKCPESSEFVENDPCHSPNVQGIPKLNEDHLVLH